MKKITPPEKTATPSKSGKQPSSRGRKASKVCSPAGEPSTSPKARDLLAKIDALRAELGHPSEPLPRKIGSLWSMRKQLMELELELAVRTSKDPPRLSPRGGSREAPVSRSGALGLQAEDGSMLLLRQGTETGTGTREGGPGLPPPEGAESGPGRAPCYYCGRPATSVGERLRPTCDRHRLVRVKGAGDVVSDEYGGRYASLHYAEAVQQYRRMGGR